MRSTWWRVSILLVALGLLALPLLGCKRFIYAVPSPLVRYYDGAAPITVGLLMAPELRDSWFRYNSESMRKRVDVPTGKLTLDFARANLREAFEHFYDERYYDRRSEEGLLIKLERIGFVLDGIEVEVALHLRVEDESKTDILTKVYQVRGKISPNRLTPRIPFYGEKPQKSIERNTAVAFEAIYGELVTDILVLVGMVAPPPPETPLPEASPVPTLAPPTDFPAAMPPNVEAVVPAETVVPAAVPSEPDAPLPATGAAPTQMAPADELQRPWQID